MTFYFFYKTQSLILTKFVNFCSLNLVQSFEKIDAIWLFSLNILKRIKRFFIKINSMIILVTPTKQNILINHFNFQQIETKKTLDNQLDISGQIKKQKK